MYPDTLVSVPNTACTLASVKTSVYKAHSLSPFIKVLQLDFMTVKLISSAVPVRLRDFLER
jgi:hypothetical protein